MKKDGIQTRNRKLAAKAKKRRMHDFFKPLDPRFGAYGGMGSMGLNSSFASCYGPSVAANPMSQYYAANTMGAQMSQFMSPSSMAHMAAASMGTAAGDPTHQRFDALSQQDNLGLHQSLGGHHHQHQQDSPTSSSASAMMVSHSPTSPDVMGSSPYNNSAAAAAAAAAAMTASAYSWSAKDAVSAAAALTSSHNNESQQQHPSSSSPASTSVVTPTSMVGASE